MANESRPLEPPTINLFGEVSHCNESPELMSVKTTLKCCPLGTSTHIVIGSLAVANVQSKERDHGRI